MQRHSLRVLTIQSRKTPGRKKNEKTESAQELFLHDWVEAFSVPILHKLIRAIGGEFVLILKQKFCNMYKS